MKCAPLTSVKSLLVHQKPVWQGHGQEYRIGELDSCSRQSILLFCTVSDCHEYLLSVYKRNYPRILTQLNTPIFKDAVGFYPGFKLFLYMYTFADLSSHCPGVQVLLCDYDFSSKKSPTFNEEHIMNIFPIIKHTYPKVCLLTLQSYWMLWHWHVTLMLDLWI